METREIRNEKTIVIFAVTDFTDSITAKIFTKNEFLPQVLSNLKVGKFVRMKAMAVMDKYDHGIALNSVMGIKNIPDFTEKRMDLSPVKRVELHAHTTMSDMDSV
ncbi:MAG: DNA polymerase III subunit epsilon, partial [Frisingicoccus sp.]